jgi:hypothetical protein
MKAKRTIFNGIPGFFFAGCVELDNDIDVPWGSSKVSI